MQNCASIEFHGKSISVDHDDLYKGLALALTHRFWSSLLSLSSHL